MLTLFSKTELKCLNDVHLRYAFTLDNGNCPPAYFDIMNKCLWLTCGGSNHTYAEYRCSQNFGTLASLDETGMTRLAEYLDHIRARSVGITQVSYVLKSESYNALPAHTLREFIRLPNGGGAHIRGGGGDPSPSFSKSVNKIASFKGKQRILIFEIWPAFSAAKCFETDLTLS